MSTATTQSGGKTAAGPKRAKWVRRLLALALVAAGAAMAVRHFLPGEPQPGGRSQGEGAYTLAQVTYRDITSTITGSGSLEAANSYSVTSLAEGTILTTDFEEGDRVEKGQLLYTIDSSNVSSSLERAQISLEQSQRSYNSKLDSREDLDVRATVTGRVLSLSVEEGDEVMSGQTVATIRDTDTMTLTVPFPADDAAGFYVGQPASVTLDSTFEVLPGTISKISAIDTVLTGNIIVRQVEIDVANPGGLTVSQMATAEVEGVGSSAGGAFAYKAEGTVTAKLSGTVAALRVAEGDRVAKDQVLLTLESESLENEIQNASESLRTAQLSLESQYDQLDNYNITSPIEGTVIDKNFKAGETSEQGRTLCTIYDLSYLTMTLNVDELDIADLTVGQTVDVTADAAEGRTYQGVVTKVSVAGTASGGVTTYPVTIRIDETDGLLPGMNADATIVLQSARDVLTIPTSALNRGNTVLLTADSPSAAGGTPVSTGGTGDEGEGETTEYVSVAVTVGVSDDDYMEVTSGLQEGDTVAYIPTSSSNNAFGMMGGMWSGGGMPGGMGGGMPGGGGGRPGGF